jgi:hypothetical protein
MQEDEWLSTAEFLMFAGGNENRADFLLGYIAAHCPPDILFHAVRARMRFEEAGSAWRNMANWATDRPYDDRD